MESIWEGGSRPRCTKSLRAAFSLLRHWFVSNICPKASCWLKRHHSRFTAMMCHDSVMDEHAHLHSQAANISAGMLVEAVGAVALKGYESGFTNVRVHSGQRRRGSKRKNEHDRLKLFV